MSVQNNVGVIILAAGKGSRMQSDLPKVMHEVDGVPLVGRVVESVEQSDVCQQPIIIVSPEHDMVQEYLQDRARYVTQDKQLGTGHAAACGQSACTGQEDIIVVLYGDHPYIQPASIARLIAEHTTNNNKLTAMTFAVPHFEGEFEPFYAFGRIIRDESGAFQKIVEMKDGTPEQQAITELNPGYACFDATWFWDNVSQLGNTNAQGEFYLTDLFGMAVDQGQSISTISIEPREAMGVNTKQDLDRANNV